MPLSATRIRAFVVAISRKWPLPLPLSVEGIALAARVTLREIVYTYRPLVTICAGDDEDARRFSALTCARVLDGQSRKELRVRQTRRATFRLAYAEKKNSIELTRSRITGARGKILCPQILHWRDKTLNTSYRYRVDIKFGRNIRVCTLSSLSISLNFFFLQRRRARLFFRIPEKNIFLQKVSTYKSRFRRFRG